MKVSIEVKSIHDLLMLDTIIDLWKAKWKAEESDDAEEELSDCDDEPAEDDADDDAEQEARQKAVDDLAMALRDAVLDGIGNPDCCNGNRKRGRC